MDETLSPEFDGHHIRCHWVSDNPRFHTNYEAVMLEVILNHHNLLARYECQLMNGGGDIHVSENQNEALGINNLRASYWPHLLSFSAVCFHSQLTVIIDHMGFRVLMVCDYYEVG